MKTTLVETTLADTTFVETTLEDTMLAETTLEETMLAETKLAETTLVETIQRTPHNFKWPYLDTWHSILWMLCDIMSSIINNASLALTDSLE